MQSQTTPLAPDDARWASASLLRITISQLRAWEAEYAPHSAAQPATDEEAWEGTELDPRRTVL
jgi:hypothetical protein